MVSQALQENTSITEDADSGSTGRACPRPNPAISTRKPPTSCFHDTWMCVYLLSELLRPQERCSETPKLLILPHIACSLLMNFHINSGSDFCLFHHNRPHLVSISTYSTCHCTEEEGVEKREGLKEQGGRWGAPIYIKGILNFKEWQDLFFPSSLSNLVTHDEASRAGFLSIKNTGKCTWVRTHVQGHKARSARRGEPVRHAEIRKATSDAASESGAWCLYAKLLTVVDTNTLCGYTDDGRRRALGGALLTKQKHCFNCPLTSSKSGLAQLTGFYRWHELGAAVVVQLLLAALQKTDTCRNTVLSHLIRAHGPVQLSHSRVARFNDVYQSLTHQSRLLTSENSVQPGLKRSSLLLLMTAQK